MLPLQVSLCSHRQTGSEDIPLESALVHGPWSMGPWSGSCWASLECCRLSWQTWSFSQKNGGAYPTRSLGSLFPFWISSQGNVPNISKHVGFTPLTQRPSDLLSSLLCCLRRSWLSTPGGPGWQARAEATLCAVQKAPSCSSGDKQDGYLSSLWLLSVGWMI